MRRKLFEVLVLQLLISPMIFVSWAGMIERPIDDRQSSFASAARYQDPQRKKSPPEDYVLFDEAPKPIKQVQPEYPPEALKNRTAGIVWIKLWVSETGDVEQAVVTKSDAEILNKSATDASSKWKFKPATLKGKPVATWVLMPFRFTIFGPKSKSMEMDKDSLKK